VKKKRILSLVLIYAILASILLTNDNLEVSAAQTFKDVKTSDWFYKDVMYAKQTGFMKGYSDNTFRPQNTMDVSTFVQLLMKATNVEYSASAHSWMI